jgi:tetratricopeptide (TPR) repeat protein
VRHDSFHLVQRAWAAYQAKRYDLAEKEARGALALAPNNPDALSILSICATERKDRATAVQFAEQAITHGPDIALYHYRLALVHGRFGDHQAAEPPLKTALELDPSFAPAYSLYAWVYFARGHINIALRAIDEALKYDPHEAYALNLRIVLLQARGDQQAAHRAAMEALRINPENTQAHTMVGMQELRNRKHKRAIPHLKAALELAPDAPKVQMAYVQALEGQSYLSRTILQPNHFFSYPILTPFWPFCWALYLMSRQLEGPVFLWPWIGIAIAIAFHALLICGWWGPWVSYVLVRGDPEIRRILDASCKPLERAKLGPWQFLMTAAIAVSTASLVLPGDNYALVVGVLAACGFASILGRIAVEYPREAAFVALVVIGFVAVGALPALMSHLAVKNADGKR